MDEGTLAELADCHDHIRACLAGHTGYCPAPLIYSPTWSNSFPLRLLDVRPSHGQRCYLVPGRDTSSPYVTLSYVWGTALPLKTLLANVQSHMADGLIIETLPKTVRDAIAVARLFNVDYVWVDALCIVQDDEEEWRVESAKMDSIYMGAYFTIAAVGAESCQDGFFGRNLYRDVVVETRTYKREKFYFDRAGPLFRRGWTLQERLLSSRILYFTATWGVYYECSKNARSVIPGDTIGRFRGQTSDETSFFLENWTYLIDGYSRRHLTVKTDTLVALQGLIKYLRTRSGFEISYGHWHHRFLDQLFWRSDAIWLHDPAPEDQEHRGQKSNAAPSWSWASLHQGEVRWPFLQSYRRPKAGYDADFSLRTIRELSAEQMAVMQSLALSSSSSSSSSSVPSYRYQSPDDRILTLKGFVLPVALISHGSRYRHFGVIPLDSNVTLTADDGPPPPQNAEQRRAQRRSKGRSKDHQLKRGSQPGARAESSDLVCSVHLEQPEIPSTAIIFLLGLASPSRRPGHSQAYHHFLVLKLVHEPNYYERIGVGVSATSHISGGTYRLSGVNQQEIVLL